jgi:hypothetical protein
MSNICFLVLNLGLIFYSHVGFIVYVICSELTDIFFLHGRTDLQS